MEGLKCVEGHFEHFLPSLTYLKEMGEMKDMAPEGAETEGAQVPVPDQSSGLGSTFSEESAASGYDVEAAAVRCAVGPGRQCSRCQMMEFNSRFDGSEFVKGRGPGRKPGASSYTLTRLSLSLSLSG